MVNCTIVNALRLCPLHAGAKSLGAVEVKCIAVLYIAHFADNSGVSLAVWLAVFVDQIRRENAVNLLFYVVVTFHRLVVVPWGGLNIVGCYSLDCLNVPGCLLVANAKMLFCATSVVFTLTPFADVHALSVKSVNTAE